MPSVKPSTGTTPSDRVPEEVREKYKSNLMDEEWWALNKEWLVVKLPLGGSDKVIMARIIEEKEILQDE